MEKLFCPLQLKPFFITQSNCTSTGLCSTKKRTNGSAAARKPMAMQNGWGVWLCKRPLYRRISDFFSFGPLAVASLQIRSSPATIRRRIKSLTKRANLTHLHSLDTPTPRLEKRLRRCTLCLCSRSSRPRSSPVRKPGWMQLHSGTWGARRDRPGSMRHQSHRPSHRAFDVQPVWTSCEGLCGTLYGGSEVISSDAKRTSSSASSRPKPAQTQQTAKLTPATPEPWHPEGRRDWGRSHSARRYPFPKR